MYFNVAQLLKEACGASRTYEISDFASVQQDAPLVAVSGALTLMRTDAGVWVSARLSSHLDCVCSRCLADMEQPVSVTIEEEYLPEVDVQTGARLHTPDDMSEQFYIDHAHMLDLSEAIRQYFDLNAPLKPVCSADCKGLCFSCGADLNEAACDCDNAIRDPRWGALLQLASAQERNYN